MPAVIIVGVQWGDEGKGKMIDILSSKADLVVRSHGGNNAGHTVIVKGVEYKFHLVPSGSLYPQTKCYITGGTVIDPSVLVKEIKEIEETGVSLQGRLFLSSFAHLIMPYHRRLDQLQEAKKGAFSIGTTGRGIGPCYCDKTARIGIQVGELLQWDLFVKHLRQVVDMKNEELVHIFHQDPLDAKEIEQEYQRYAEELTPYISSEAERQVADAIDQGKKVLFEGAHGSYLDQTFGTYPYVTSSGTLASAVAHGAAIGPTKIDHVVGVVKAYTTRVGHGPFPTELQEQEQAVFLSHQEARETATTTGRFRRMGWFDVPLVRQALSWSGVDSMAIMKLDVLDALEEIKVCVGYLLDGKEINSPPSMTSQWMNIQPIYETLPGWKTSTKEIQTYEQLPKAAKEYLKKLQQWCHCPISFVSYGPEREKTLELASLFD